MAATIQFYQLLTTSRERALAKLLAKAMDSGQRTVVRCSTDAETALLSDSLWREDPASFLPHGTARDGHAEAQPICITTGDDTPNGARIAVITDGRTVHDLSSYDKVLDMFDGRNLDALAAARLRYADYKKTGHTLSYIQQQADGSWAVQA
jgi:DNA polymerase III subunit chi